MRRPRWLEPGTTSRTRSFEVDSDARRRGPQVTSNDKNFSVTLSVGGINGFSIPWEGMSPEDARDTFLEFLRNHDEFGVGNVEPDKFFRSMYANFHGKNVLVTFRTSWITAFTIS